MKRVFVRPGYFFLATLTSLIVFVSIAWANVLPLFFRIIRDVTLPFDTALSLGSTLLVTSLTDFTLTGFVFALTTALLIGINVTFLVFYFRMFRAVPSSTTTASGLLGGIATLLGFGCAACGSVFLVSFIGALGGTGLLALLPYGGEEIGYVGIALLFVSAIFLTRAINKPLVCPI
jgi:hypothetical protein